jgi:hypothetical protein
MCNDPGQRHLSRREFHRVSAGALAAPLFGVAAARAEPQERKSPPLQAADEA